MSSKHGVCQDIKYECCGKEGESAYPRSFDKAIPLRKII